MAGVIWFMITYLIFVVFIGVDAVTVISFCFITYYIIKINTTSITSLYYYYLSV